MKKTYDTILWAGSEEGFETYQNAEENFLALDESIRKEAAIHAQVVEEASHLLEVQDGIGLLQIKGVLTHKDSWINRYVGLVSYAEIQEALYFAVADPAIKEILVDMGSPGGSVYGLTEALYAMDQAANAKPLTVFAENVMASAAMWVGIPAWKSYVGVLSSIGSIGVVQKHVEFSKMRIEAGITETIIRSGEFKYLANDSEPLSEKAREIMKSDSQYAYGVFVQSIADYLGKSYQLVDTTMAQGRGFTGQQAVDVGLVDAVSTFDEVFATMQTRIYNNNNGGGDMKKKTLMSKAVTLAAVASGANLADEQTAEELAQAAAALEAQGETPEVLAQAAVTKADEMDAKLEAQEEVTAEEQTEADALRAEAVALTEALESKGPELDAEGNEIEPEAKKEGTGGVGEPTAMDLLMTQAKAKDDEIFGLKTELAAAKVDAENLEALGGIVAEVVNNMVVALGGTKTDLSKSTVADLVAQHSATQERFMTEFVAGGVAIVGDDEEKLEPVKKVVQTSRMAQAKVKMTRKV